MSGAAPLSKELTEQLMKVLPNAQIGQGYGKPAERIIRFLCPFPAPLPRNN